MQISITENIHVGVFLNLNAEEVVYEAVKSVINFNIVIVSWAAALHIHFRGLLLRQNVARCKIHFTSKSRILVYWQHYCTVLQQFLQRTAMLVLQAMY